MNFVFFFSISSAASMDWYKKVGIFYLRSKFQPIQFSSFDVKELQKYKLTYKLSPLESLTDRAYVVLPLRTKNSDRRIS